MTTTRVDRCTQTDLNDENRGEMWRRVRALTTELQATKEENLRLQKSLSSRNSTWLNVWNQEETPNFSRSSCETPERSNPLRQYEDSAEGKKAYSVNNRDRFRQDGHLNVHQTVKVPSNFVSRVKARFEASGSITSIGTAVPPLGKMCEDNSCKRIAWPFYDLSGRSRRGNMTSRTCGESTLERVRGIAEDSGEKEAEKHGTRRVWESKASESERNSRKVDESIIAVIDTEIPTERSENNDLIVNREGVVHTLKLQQKEYVMKF